MRCGIAVAACKAGPRGINWIQASKETLFFSGQTPQVSHPFLSARRFAGAWNPSLLIEPLPWRAPEEIFAHFAADPWLAWLDSAGPEQDPRGRYSYLCVDPVEILCAQADQDPFGQLAALLARHARTAEPGPLPFMGGAVGLLGYELAAALEQLSFRHPDDLGLPDLAFGIYDHLIGFDRVAQKAWLIAPGDGPRAGAIRARLEAPPPALPPAPALLWRAEVAQADYEAAVDRVRAYIAAGDMFEANYTTRFVAERPAGLSPAALHLALRRASPNPFGAYLALGGGRALCSASPENFIRLGADGWMETRPIKGTRPRDPDPVRDQALAAELLASEKDRAENLMIVDLMRNDLGRVAEIGSVSVPELFAVEHFHSVHHLVSAIRAKLRAGLGAVDLLRASFPGGSITGAPKLRSIEVIDEVEVARRGAYCGSVVWLGFDGAMDSSIIIRSLAVGPDRIAAQAGGAILAESDPTQAYDELRVKLAPLLLGGEVIA